MRSYAWRHWILAMWLAVLTGGFLCAASPQPLPRAHAHNDYHHERPLLDALEQGFCSVEADVFVVDGQLLVGHEKSELRPDRTLQRLYLDPLRARTHEFGGSVYRDGPTFTLLIDFKSSAEPTFSVLAKLLADYKPMLAGTVDGQPREGAVRVVISGYRPLTTVAERYQTGTCLVFIDGRLPDLEVSTPRPWIPVISDDWTDHFRWKGEGAIPDEELAKLKDIVARTHGQGRQLRFWSTPDRPEMWRTLRSEGVDFINTDDLAGLASFLRAKSGVSNR